MIPINTLAYNFVHSIHSSPNTYRGVLEERYFTILHSFTINRKTKFVKARLQGLRNTKKSDNMHDLDLQGPINYIKQKFKSHTQSLLTDLLEDLAILARNLLRAVSIEDYIVAAITFYKLRTKEAILNANNLKRLTNFVTKVWSMTFGKFGLQSETFASLRETLDYWPRLKKSDLWRKTRLVVTYVTSLVLWNNSSENDNLIVKLEGVNFENPSLAICDMTYGILDLLLFVVERGYQCCKTGNFHHMFHSGGTYEKWYVEACDILAKAPYLANPGPLGLDVHAILQDCDRLIEQGLEMSKFSAEFDRMTKNLITTTTYRLQSMKYNDITKRAAHQMRRAPFALTICGHSSVAKTSFTNILHVAYSSIRKKDRTERSKFSKNSKTEYWEGYESSMHTIVMDDVVADKPGVTNGVDASIAEIINIKNNTPYSMNMAFEGKGKVPCLAELLLCTTNSPSLHADHYFSCPLALMRRMDHIIEIAPKPEYITNQVMIDPSKLPPVSPGEFADYWIISVYAIKLVPKSGDDSNISTKYHRQGKPTLQHTFNHMSDFLVWFGKEVVDYNLIQDKVLLGDRAMVTNTLCSECFKTANHCKCVNKPIDVLEDKLTTAFASSSGYKPDLEDSVDDTQLPLQSETLYGDDSFSPDYTEINDEHLGPFGLDDDDIYYQDVHPLVRWHLQSEIETGWTAFLAAMSTFLGTFICCLVGLEYGKVICTYLFANWCSNMLRVFSISAYNHVWSFIDVIDVAFRMHIYDYHGICDKITWSLEEAKIKMNALGEKVFATFKIPPLVGYILGAIVSILVVMGCVRYCTPSELDLQGNIPSVRPVTENEVESDWVKPDLTITSFEFSRRSSSWKGLPREQIIKLLQRNCAYFTMTVNGNGFRSRAVGLGGQFYLLNNHTVPEFVSTLDCHIVTGPTNFITSNVNCVLTPADITRYPERDMCIIRCKGLPNKANIIDLFASEQLSYRGPAEYVSRDNHGDPDLCSVSVTRKVKVLVRKLNVYLDILQGKVKQDTISGYCGALAFAMTTKGVVCLGIHEMGGHNCDIGILPITCEWLKTLNLNIIEPTSPMLDTPTTSSCVLGSVHHKSPVNFMKEGNMLIHGSLQGFRATSESSVVPTIISEEIYDLGYPRKFFKPDMRGWKPWYRMMTEAADGNCSMRNDILTLSRNAMVKRWLGANTKYHHNLQIYDNFTAINGVPGLRYVDKINRNTSAGAPWRKSKKFFFSTLPEESGVALPIAFNDEIMERVERRMELYSEGCQSHPMFVGTLKDEPLSQKKIDINKIRVFQSSPVDFTIVMRRLLLGFTRVVQSNNELFEASPGINAHGSDWERLYHRLITHGEHKMIAGDFKDYDISMKANVLLAAFEAIVDFHKACGATEQHCRMITALSYDIVFPLVDINGSCVTLFGKNPSGQALTVIINGIVNCLYMRYVFCILGEDQKFSHEKSLMLWDSNIELTTYGDDNVIGVSDRVNWFNHTSIQNVLKKFNITYTMAQKEAKSSKFIHMNEVDFLKRRFVYDPDIKAVVAPLEMDSIIKSLTIGTVGSLSNEELVIAVMQSALGEFFYHGKETFELWRKRLLAICSREDLKDYKFWIEPYTWERFYRRFHRIEEDFQNFGHEYDLDLQCETFSDLEFRTCRVCSGFKFDEIESDCPHCGWNDTCEVCASPILDTVTWNGTIHMCKSCNKDSDVSTVSINMGALVLSRTTSL